MRPLTACTHFLLLTVLAALTALPAATIDPRPAVLVIGDFQVQPFRGEPSWANLIATRHPEWRVIVDADGNRLFGATLETPKRHRDEVTGTVVWPGLDDEFSAILDRSGPVEAVVLMLGGNHPIAEIAAARSPDQFASACAAALDGLASHPNSSAAAVLVVTPVPVVERRLDRWSAERFAGGEAISRALAEALRAAAKDRDLPVFDAWQRIYDDRSDGKPGRLVGSAGWIKPGWAHREFADWIEPSLIALNPQPRDPAAFTTWQHTIAAERALDQVLAATSSGEVRHGPALATSRNDREHQLHVEIPAQALHGRTVSLLFKPQAVDSIASLAAGNAAFGTERPRLRVPTADGPVVITADLNGSSLLDEATPDDSVSMILYGINSGKWRPFPVVTSTLTQRRWLLVRFSLPPGLAATADAEATFSLNFAQGSTQMLERNRPGRYIKGRWSPLSVHLITGSDGSFDPLSATWHQRGDGVGWTGGTVDRQARAAALETLLQGDLPRATARRARAELNAANGDQRH